MVSTFTKRTWDKNGIEKNKHRFTCGSQETAKELDSGIKFVQGGVCSTERGDFILSISCCKLL